MKTLLELQAISLEMFTHVRPSPGKGRMWTVGRQLTALNETSPRRRHMRLLEWNSEAPN